MANTVRRDIILNGAPGALIVFRLYLASDGITGDLNNYVLWDPQVDSVPPQPLGRALVLEKVQSSNLHGFIATLSFDGGMDGPWPFLTLTPEVRKADFRSTSNIADGSGGVAGLNASGKLLLSTQGLTSASASGDFTLQFHRMN